MQRCCRNERLADIGISAASSVLSPALAAEAKSFMQQVLLIIRQNDGIPAAQPAATDEAHRSQLLSYSAFLTFGCDGQSRAFLWAVGNEQEGVQVNRYQTQKRIILTLLMAIALPVGARAQGSIEISLKQAVESALEPHGNTQIQLAREAIRQASAQAMETRATLLPNISGTTGMRNQTTSLATAGLSTLIPGINLPSVIGPYKTFDARGYFTQKLFDAGAIRQYQAAQTGTQAAKVQSEAVQDETTAEIARAYFSAVRAQEVVEMAEANVALSESLLRLSESQKEAGTGTGIDVTRARVQLSNDRQSLLVSQTAFTNARLSLLRKLGIDLDVQIDLTDRLVYTALDPISVKEALGTAYESLPQLKAQQLRERRAEQVHSAAKLERAPAIIGFADYGTTGLSAGDTNPTRAFGVSIQIPIFDGGARDAHRAETASALNQEHIRTTDLFRETELKIRIALDAVKSADAQVKTAEEGLALSQNELEQARRRYAAGVAGSIEVTDAQTRLQRAQDNRISAIFNHAVARVDLAAAMGTIQQLVNNWR
jgi:outer membrane protein